MSRKPTTEESLAIAQLSQAVAAGAIDAATAASECSDPSMRAAAILRGLAIALGAAAGRFGASSADVTSLKQTVHRARRGYITRAEAEMQKRATSPGGQA